VRLREDPRRSPVTVYDFAEDQERVMQYGLGSIDHVVRRTEELRYG
jgi:hypothetical protein